MRIYTVHIRSGFDTADADAIVVKEGFNWAAFLFTGFWALFRRLWLAAALIFAVVVALNILLSAVDADGLVTGAVQIGLGIVVGFGANDWRRAALARRGFEEHGPIAAPDTDAALLYFAEQIRAEQPIPSDPDGQGPAPAAGGAPA